MKKFFLSVFMFALIAGASVNSTANAPVSESSGIAMPHLIYCLTKSELALSAASAGATASAAAGAYWAIKLGYGLAVVAGVSGVGLLGGLALGY